MSRGSEDTARRPPSVKASLSVSFGQPAPHRASTRAQTIIRTETGRGRETGKGKGRGDYDNDRRSRRDYESSRSRRSDYEDDRSRSRSVQIEREPTPKRDYGNKDKAAAATVNSNLAKLKDLYGDASRVRKAGMKDMEQGGIQVQKK